MNNPWKWSLIAMTAMLTSCGAFLGLLAGTKVLNDDPFKLDGKEFLTTTPFQKLDVVGTGTYLRPKFEDFEVTGNPSVKPHRITLQIFLDHVLFNSSCPSQATSVQIKITDVKAVVEDRMDTSSPRSVSGQANPATLTMLATQLEKGKFGVPADTALNIQFGPELYDLVTTAGTNSATLTARVILNQDSFVNCKAALVVKEHNLILADFR